MGLGPNFVPGQTTHLAVETSWGESLGRIVDSGTPLSLAGAPRPILGHGRDQFVYVPRAGVFKINGQIGEQVLRGQTVARIDGLEVKAPFKFLRSTYGVPPADPSRSGS